VHEMDEGLHSYCNPRRNTAFLLEDLRENRLEYLSQYGSV